MTIDPMLGFGSRVATVYTVDDTMERRCRRERGPGQLSLTAGIRAYRSSGA